MNPNDWLYFAVGNVCFWLKPTEGKFPQLERLTQQTDNFSWATIDRNDADFVAQRLENLPGKADEGSPVCIVLNQCFAVRGHDQTQQTATELRLTRSVCEGKPLTMSLNRWFLKNALDFGVNRLGFDPAKQSPIVGHGDNRTFVMMPLELAEPVIEASKITVLASDAYSVTPPKAVKANAGEVNGAVKSYEVKDSVVKPQAVIRQIPQPDNRKIEPFASSVDVIADSENLCRTLADTLRVTQQLVRNLKLQRKQNRLMRATISSLKQLQGC